MTSLCMGSVAWGHRHSCLFCQSFLTHRLTVDPRAGPGPGLVLAHGSPDPCRKPIRPGSRADSFTGTTAAQTCLVAAGLGWAADPGPVIPSSCRGRHVQALREGTAALPVSGRDRCRPGHRSWLFRPWGEAARLFHRLMMETSRCWPTGLPCRIASARRNPGGLCHPHLKRPLPGGIPAACSGRNSPMEPA